MFTVVTGFGHHQYRCYFDFITSYERGYETETATVLMRGKARNHSKQHFSGDGEDHHQPSAWNRQAVDGLGESRRSGESTPHGGGNRRLHQGETKEKEAGKAQLESALKIAENWAKSVEEEENNGDGFTVVSHKKRRRESGSSGTTGAQSSGAVPRRVTTTTPRGNTPRMRSPQVQEIKTTRAHIADPKAQQASSTQEYCVYIEQCSDFSPYQYLRAVDAVVGGPRNILQITRMNGHALQPYGRVTSIALMQFKLGEYTYADGRREAFVLLNNGVTLGHLPTRLDIRTKGDTLPAFLTFGIKCSNQGSQHPLLQLWRCRFLHLRPLPILWRYPMLVLQTRLCPIDQLILGLLHWHPQPQLWRHYLLLQRPLLHLQRCQVLVPRLTLRPVGSLSLILLGRRRLLLM
ncbi:hypothetical protein LAZ67_14002259 [Cordylochernes scorpioides]|uniref:Uncharacterized protein n=1 Tax=Cordylochernes scorpioides TaxID=51811 RepID=A0ABY6L6T3_9ARAC|nr:hypothetical protein LAZ67_14002259 [Cordylochernes scorpioides]